MTMSITRTYRNWLHLVLPVRARTYRSFTGVKNVYTLDCKSISHQLLLLMLKQTAAQNSDVKISCEQQEHDVPEPTSRNVNIEGSFNLRVRYHRNIFHCHPCVGGACSFTETSDLLQRPQLASVDIYAIPNIEACHLIGKL
jgi:hypothetical protein